MNAQPTIEQMKAQLETWGATFGSVHGEHAIFAPDGKILAHSSLLHPSIQVAYYAMLNAQQPASEAPAQEGKFKVGDKVQQIGHEGVGTVYEVNSENTAIRLIWEDGTTGRRFWPMSDYEFAPAQTDPQANELAAAQARIAQLETELARVNQLVEAAFGKLCFPNSYLSDTEAKELLRQALQEKPQQPRPAPVQAVTLTYSDNPEMLDDYSGHDYDVDVVGWFAEHEIITGNLRGDFAVTIIGESIPAFVYKFCSDITPSYLTDECYFDKYFRLNPEFNTEANRAAIAARRKELGLV